MAKMESDERLSKGEKKETIKLADKEARKKLGVMKNRCTVLKVLGS
jgi:hypothetical protein